MESGESDFTLSKKLLVNKIFLKLGNSPTELPYMCGGECVVGKVMTWGEECN